ncbi:hypothetical protein HDU81_010123 [Chytriomyces hyalinus]|nr:hypothetical protein HDU81_010123 [Chytriomyces hyalinus]
MKSVYGTKEPRQLLAPEGFTCLCGKVAGASRSVVCRGGCKTRFHVRCIDRSPNTPYFCRKCKGSSPTIPTPRPTPNVAMKTPRIPMPVLISAVDEDDDLCPVCDGDCTCNASKPTPVKPMPIPQQIQVQVPKVPVFQQQSKPPVAKPRKMSLSGQQKEKATASSVSFKHLHKSEDLRRMVISNADIIMDEDGNAWKSKSIVKRAGPREYAKMSLALPQVSLKDAPVMKQSGSFWIVQDVKSHSAPEKMFRKNAVFDSTSDSDSDVAQVYSKAMKTAKKSQPQQSPLHNVVEPSSDLDSDTGVSAKAHMFNSSSDSSSDSEEETKYSSGLMHAPAPASEIGERNGASDPMRVSSPPLVEYEVALDAHVDTENSDAESQSSQESSGDFMSDGSDDMDIDAIFAAADDSGDESEESDINIFVENALNGGWSSSDEFEDSDEDSLVGVMENGDDSASECLSDKLTDTVGSEVGDMEFIKAGSMDPEKNEPQQVEIPTNKEDALSNGANDTPRPLVNFDIKKTHIGPNGEITTTTKSMTLQIPKPKPQAKKKVAQTKPQGNQPAGGESSISAPQSSLAPLISALNSITTNGAPQKEKMGQLLNAIVSALKTAAPAVIAPHSGNSAHASDLHRRTIAKTGVSNGRPTTEEGVAAQNVAALAVLAAAVASAKMKLAQQTSKKVDSQDGTSLKTVEELLTTAIPAIISAQKQQHLQQNLPQQLNQQQQQQQQSHLNLHERSNLVNHVNATSKPFPVSVVTLDEVFDTEALEFSDSGDNHNTDDFDLNEHFSRWTRVPIGAFRRARKSSLSKVHKKDLKKAFRFSKASPAITLSSNNLYDTNFMGETGKSPRIDMFRDRDATSMLFQSIPSLPSPLLPPSYAFMESDEFPKRWTATPFPPQ